MDIGSKYKPPANYQKASSFDQLSLDSRLLEALKSAGLDSPTDIQVRGGDRAGPHRLI
jgi:superfamily II DNA/RNA helicase